MSNVHFKKQWLLLTLVVVTLAFAFQGSRGLWRPDEGRYVRCAYEMLKTGDWIIPQLNFQPHFTKPPITYWCVASGLTIFGKNEWGARFFHAVAFALTALAVGLLGRRMWGDREGLLAGLIYATSIMPFIAGNIVTTDTILTCFETLGVAAFWFGFTTGGGIRRRLPWAAVTGFLFGLAFLTKGPPGLLPLIAILAFVFLRKDAKRPSAGLLFAGVAVFVLTAAPWYLEVLREMKGLLSYFMNHEVVGRIFTGEQHRNPGLFGPFKVYLPVLTAGALPWSLAWLVILKKSRPSLLRRQWWTGLRERPKALFLLTWFSLPLLIFCLASSRLQLYVLPLFAPLALITARGLTKYFPEAISDILQAKGKPALAVGLLTVLLLASKLIVAYAHVSRDDRAMWHGIQGAIQSRVGNSPYEIITVHSDFDGLAFYSNSNVERLRSSQGSTYLPSDVAKQEYDELFSTNYAHIFLTEKKYKDEVVSELRKRNIEYAIAPAPFGRLLVFCEKSNPLEKAFTCLAIIGDPGNDQAARTLLVSTLYQVDQSLSLEGILLAGDAIAAQSAEGEPAEFFRKYFEEPFAPLIENKVPFFGSLGNHSLKYVDYQLNYPLFNMKGRRYYSEIFGPNRVEVFLLDPDTIEQASEQLEWLTRSLKASTALWKTVIVPHAGSATTDSGKNTEMAALIEPLMIKYKVDLTVYGDCDRYETLHPDSDGKHISLGRNGNPAGNLLIPYPSKQTLKEKGSNVLLVLRFTDDSCHFSAYTAGRKIIDEGDIEKEYSHRPPESQNIPEIAVRELRSGAYQQRKGEPVRPG